MLLKMKTIQTLINRDRNQSAIASKTKLSQAIVNKIANCKNIEQSEHLDSTRQKLSDYFVHEFNYMKQVIIEARGE